MNGAEKLLALAPSKVFSYDSYRELLAHLHAEEKTTGDTQSETYIHFSKLNEHRMGRLDKTAKIAEATIESLKNAPEQSWYVISEGWCGDAAQNVPWLAKIAEALPNVTLKIVLRDENPDIMDEYLTNGGKSIPKLIGIDTSGNELFTWGPRPSDVQKIVMDNKHSDHPKPYEELQIDVQKWYLKDKGLSLQRELLALVLR